MNNKIEIRDLKKSFESKHILTGLNLNVIEGEILCVIGKSGTGKSVIMKHLTGILKPDGGDIIVDGKFYSSSTQDELDALISKFGILFQGAALFDSMNIYDNVAFGLRRKKVSEEEINPLIKSLLAQVELYNVENRMPSELSGGMQKRVGLARALAIKPEIMLYDEPTTGVDPITAAAVDRLILKMRSEFKITSVVVTHDINSACRIADRIAMLYEGKIIYTGSPDDIMKSENEIIKQFIEGRADGPIQIF
jgi:phospholipid/cholesterol/gamma-HCH transport system ATP-binding protein